MPVIIPVRELNRPELEPYAGLNEPQLKHYFEPDTGLFIAETLNVAERALAAGYQPVSFLTEERFIPQVTQLLETYCSACPASGTAAINPGDAGGAMDSGDAAGAAGTSQDIPLYTAPLNVLIDITGYNLTRGVLGLMRRLPLPSVGDICRSARRLVVLENVGNPTNIGAIFRSAAALGMDGILLTADCCDPLYRRALRVSMGTVFQIPWTYMPAWHTEVLKYVDEKTGIYRKEDARYSAYWPAQGIKVLKDMNFTTISLALTDQAVPIDDPSIPVRNRLALILGNEGYGLNDATIEASDYAAIIPMAHGVDSLNVAAASAVAFWQLGRQSG